MQTDVLHKSEILASEQLTHNVKRFVVEKPDGYRFKAGQATNVSLDIDGWQDQKHPFTFTSLNHDENLEFTVKLYPEHNGMTKRMDKSKVGDKFILREPWGSITYQGPGTFIAGGAGVTPFIAILRQLEAVASGDDDDAFRACRLLFSNKTEDDVFLQGELTRMLGDRAMFTLTQQEVDGYLHGRIDSDMLRKLAGPLDKPFYLCGPPNMVNYLCEVLSQIGVSDEQLITEN